MNSRILSLSARCIARTERTALIRTELNVNSEEFIYNPGFVLNTMYYKFTRSFIEQRQFPKSNHFWDKRK